MTSWIALFRGINVGGNNLLPMAELRDDLELLKFKNVRSYIQSGNIVFDSSTKTAATLARKIENLVEKKHGFKPHILVFDGGALRSAIEANPFSKAVSDPKTLHFSFLAEPAVDADLAALRNAKANSEKFKLTDSVFYLHAPDGIGRSKLAANAEKFLGVVTTARNFRTVEKLASMLT